MDNKVNKILKELTLEEKAGLCSGKDFWNLKGVERLDIPEIMVTDGPHGLRKQQANADNLGLNTSVPATCFPSGAGLAATWNRDLLNKVGQSLGQEAKANDVSVLLGPAINIKRNPLCGRNFEYYSEDPYLTGELAASYIKGVQSEGVGTSLKHFAANNQETNRMSINAVADERALREIYLTGFEKAVKEAQPWTVMCAYNRLNGEYCSENHWLLTDVLKNDWGHKGFVMTDWGAVNERVKGLKAGLELEMPGSGGYNDKKIVAAVKSGELEESVLDEAVARILNIIFMADATLKGKENVLDTTTLLKKNHEIARDAAAEAVVLLKNDKKLLPLKTEGKIAFIGAFADKARYQGGGSSHINPRFLDSALEEAKTLTEGKAEILYAAGYDPLTEDVNAALIKEAKKTAKAADKVVLFIGLTDLFESEGFDRKHLGIPENHIKLLKEILSVNPETIVVLSNGAPVEMPWIQNVSAVLESYLGGQGWGHAITQIIFGKKTPSGKLPETFAKRLEDYPSYINFPGDENTVMYNEGVFVGYRGFEAKNQSVLFPFGHGLSYTSFEYSNMTLSSSKITEDENMTVTVSVKNTGLYEGKEIVQLYITDEKSSVLRPKKELKGFEKVKLEPEESKTVTFKLDRRSFAFWHPTLGGWRVESGTFTVHVGSSSADIRLSKSFTVKAAHWTDVTYDRGTRLAQLKDHPVVGNYISGLIKKMTVSFGDSDPETPEGMMMTAMVQEMPLKSVVSFSCGQTLKEEQLEILLAVLNGKEKPSSLDFIDA